MVVEPCHGLLETPVREGATDTDDTDDRPEDTTVTGGVVVGSRGQNVRHNALQKKFKNEHMGQLES